MGLGQRLPDGQDGFFCGNLPEIPLPVNLNPLHGVQIFLKPQADLSALRLDEEVRGVNAGKILQGEEKDAVLLEDRGDRLVEGAVQKQFVIAGAEIDTVEFVDESYSPPGG